MQPWVLWVNQVMHDAGGCMVLMLSSLESATKYDGEQIDPALGALGVFAPEQLVFDTSKL